MVRGKKINPPVRPSRRVEHAMAFDTQRGKTMLFGGVTINPNGTDVVDGQTWEYGDAWSNISTANASPARAARAMAYDAKRDRLVMFGGATLLTIATTVRVNDTWESDQTCYMAVESQCFAKSENS